MIIVKVEMEKMTNGTEKAFSNSVYLLNDLHIKNNPYEAHRTLISKKSEGERC